MSSSLPLFPRMKAPVARASTRLNAYLDQNGLKIRTPPPPPPLLAGTVVSVWASKSVNGNVKLFSCLIYIYIYIYIYLCIRSDRGYCHQTRLWLAVKNGEK